jgi:hypothetical protein
LYRAGPDLFRVSLEASDRKQVLDAIITYGGELVVVVENKISWCDPTEQPHRVNLHGAPVQFEEQARSVQWQDLLAMLSDLVQRDLVAGAERLVIEDFLDLVEAYFPTIGPYSTISRCGTNTFRLERRLDAVQGFAVGTEEGKAQGWRNIGGTEKIFMAWLGYRSDVSTVSLRMYPADTLLQARHFYADPDSVKAVLALQSQDWRVEPNFHWGFMASGHAWAPSACAVEDYCAYWVKHIGESRELARSEWDSYLTMLQANSILDASGKDAFEQEFAGSQRQKASPRPGLFCEFTWPLAEAARLDARGAFVDAVRHRINEMLAALQSPLLM